GGCPLQQRISANRECAAGLVRQRQERTVRKRVDRQAMPAFGAAIKPLGMQHAIHLRRARRGVEAVPPGEGGGERLGGGPPAVEAGAMTGSERSRLVEEEQFGVAAPQTSR